jgi:signal transduction histidine kinase/ActR/RegA family two-component response regulator
LADRLDMGNCGPKARSYLAPDAQGEAPPSAQSFNQIFFNRAGDGVRKAAASVNTTLGLASSWRWIAAVALVLAAQAVAAAVLGPGSKLTAFSYILLFLLIIVATCAFAYNSFVGRDGSRSFWGLLALGMAVWALDQWLWIYYQFRFHTGMPNRSIGDPALFLHIVPLMAALATRPHLMPSTRRFHQTTFSFLLLLFFWVFLYAYFVFPYQFLFPDPGVYCLRYNSLYFCESIAFISLAGILIHRSALPWKSLYAHLLGAAGLYALTSEWVNNAINNGATHPYYPGCFYDLGFTAAACWFILVAIQGRNLSASCQRPAAFNTRLARYAAVSAILGAVMVPLLGIWTLYNVKTPLPFQKAQLLIILIFASIFAPLVFLQMYVANLDLHKEISVRHKAEDELREATAAAQAANRAKAEFLANMSHEIRTPMNGILGMTELALESQLTAEQRECLQMTKSSAESLLTIINDILDFSKVDAGKLEMESVDFDLKDTLVQIAKTFAQRAAAKDLHLVCVIRPDVAEFVTGDPTRLRQIIVNLLSNALKFTDQGKIVLRVESEPSASALGLLHFSVQDTGIGIAREKQELIFKAFEQADGSTTRKFGGTGLGLTISGRLVQLMGGTIWVESQVGVGSTFHFTVCFGKARKPRPSPPLDAPAAISNPAEAILLTPRPLRAERSALRILLAEDNLVNQRLAVRLLEKRGHRVALAATGRQALAALAHDRFDLVLMDVQMPEMDGLETTAAIREEEKKSGFHLPIIAMTAHSMRGDRERCLVAGMDGYVAKPVTSGELFAAIEEITLRLKPCPPPPPESSAGHSECTK